MMCLHIWSARDSKYGHSTAYLYHSVPTNYDQTMCAAHASPTLSQSQTPSDQRSCGLCEPAGWLINLLVAHGAMDGQTMHGPCPCLCILVNGAILASRCAVWIYMCLCWPAYIYLDLIWTCVRVWASNNNKNNNKIKSCDPRHSLHSADCIIMRHLHMQYTTTHMDGCCQVLGGWLHVTWELRLCMWAASLVFCMFLWTTCLLLLG